MLKVEPAVAGHIFTGRLLETVLPEVSQMGFRGIEFSDMGVLSNPAEVHRILSSFMMRFTCFIFDWPIPENSDAIMAALQRTGCNRIIIRVGADANDDDLAADVALLAVRVAPRGLRVSVCASAFGYERTEEFCELVTEDSCGLVADNAELYRNGIDGGEYIKRFGSRIDYVRLGDVGGDGEPVIPGKGKANPEAFFKALDAINYYGWLTIVPPDYAAAQGARDFFQEKLGVYSRS